jgi:hypothetical protein
MSLGSTGRSSAKRGDGRGEHTGVIAGVAQHPEEERAICMGLNQVVLSEGRGCWVLQP